MEEQQGSATEKQGGMAFEVILKPASGEAPNIHASSPTREKPLSQEDIDRKLKEAEDRRLVRFGSENERGWVFLR